MGKQVQRGYKTLKTGPVLLLLFIDVIIALAVSHFYGNQLYSYEIADYASSIKMLLIFDFCMVGYAKLRLRNKIEARNYLLFACIFAIYPLFEIGNLHIQIDFKIHQIFHWDRGVDKITRRINDLVGLIFFISIFIIGFRMIKKIPGYKINNAYIKIGVTIFIFSLILDLMTTRPSVFEIFIKDEDLSFTLGTITSLFEEILEVFCLNYFLLFFYYSLKEKSKKRVVIKNRRLSSL